MSLFQTILICILIPTLIVFVAAICIRDTKPDHFERADDVAVISMWLLMAVVVILTYTEVAL